MPALDWDFIVRFLNITLIDVALSGDNAIVIGMAAASLPPAKRKWALLMGGAIAIVLRISLTAIASFLMLIPLLSAIGAIVLLWVVYKLVRPAPPPVAEAERHQEARNFRQAIVLILTADFMMSVDNVLAVAGSAHGNLVLLVLGLLLSMPLLMVTGGIISSLIERARWLVYVGAGAICFTAARMFLEDRIIVERFHVTQGLELAIALVCTLALPPILALVPARFAKKSPG
ncbi:MAG TPA: YjbE family putative metal transport protein [Rectinemataceae bacterium]|nr:YjbE family putative metal transport protein [Rectinemataceae bacterium]